MKPIAELWDQFTKSAVIGHSLVVACRRCGSSYLDAGLPSTQLHCCLCGNTTHFDDERFVGIRVNLVKSLDLTTDQTRKLFDAMGRDFSRIEGAQRSLEEKDRREGDHHHDLLNAMNAFLSSFSNISSNLKIDAAARKNLAEEWESTKARLDIIIKSISNV